MGLQLDQLVVHYPGRAAPAVAGVSLALGAGQIGVLIGPSGCGKTSLLRAVAGLQPVAGGSLRLDGAPLAGTPPEHRGMGMVAQDFALFPHLTVARNVGFGLAHLPRAQREARVAEMLALVDLADAGGRMPHELSGGQQQRVALARALARQPRLLLLDEPFSSLDVDLRERLAQDVRAILKTAGTTALMVTHDQHEAFALGDVIGVMQGGRLHQWDDAYALYHRPATRFVAGFIGHGVFVPGEVRPGQGVHTALGELVDEGACAVAGGACDVLLRADDILHDDAAPVRAQVERKAFRGSTFLYTLRLASGERVEALVPSHHDHALGEWIGIRPEVAHVVTFARQAAATGAEQSA